MANGLITETIYYAAGRVIVIKNYRDKNNLCWRDETSGRANENQNLNLEANNSGNTAPETQQQGSLPSDQKIKETGFDSLEKLKVKTGYQDIESGHDKTSKSYAYLYNAAGERTYQIDDEGNVSVYQYDEISRISSAAYPFRSNKKVEDLRERLYLGLFPEHEIVKSDKDDFDFDLPKINIPYHDNEKFEEALKTVFIDNDNLFKAYRKLDSQHFPKWKIKKGFDGTEFIKKLDLDSNTLYNLKNAYAKIGNHKYFNPEQWMWLENFDYDVNSNITAKSNGWGKVEYAYDTANALLSAGNRKYAYDDNGNLTKENLSYIEASYEYNPENRITDIYTEIEGFICHNKWKLKGGVGYEYDAFGRRSAAADYVYRGFKHKEWNVETNENYFYDGLSMNVLAEFWQEDFDKNQGHHYGWGWWRYHFGKHNPVSEYIYGNGKIINRTDFEKSNQWFGEHPNPKWNDKIYYSQDVLDSVMLLTKHLGQPVEEYNYDVFGNNYDGTFLKRNEFGFNGKRFDPVVELYDYGFRDYSPVMMRWTTVDPIYAGTNWYVYCNNNPISFKDPTGLKTWFTNGTCFEGMEKKWDSRIYFTKYDPTLPQNIANALEGEDANVGYLSWSGDNTKKARKEMIKDFQKK